MVTFYYKVQTYSKQALHTKHCDLCGLCGVLGVCVLCSNSWSGHNRNNSLAVKGLVWSRLSKINAKFFPK